MTAVPPFIVTGTRATGDVPTVQANGTLAWAAPSGGSLPDEITSPGPGQLVFAPTDPTVVPLKFRVPVGASIPNESNVIEQYDENGNLMFYLDAAGEVEFCASPFYATKHVVWVADWLFDPARYKAFEITDSAITIDGRGGLVSIQYGATGSAILVWGTGIVTYLAAGTTLTVKNHNNTPVLTVGEDGTIVAPSLPTSDPAVAGSLWVDTTAGFVVKQSQG